MLDLLAFGEKDRVFADVRGEVGDALEVAAHEQQLERRRDELRGRPSCASAGCGTRESCSASTSSSALADLAAEAPSARTNASSASLSIAPRAARHVLDRGVGR